MKRSLRQKNSSSRDFLPLCIVFLFFAVWAAGFSLYTSFLHEKFRSTSLDMALHAQILWNLWRGVFMETSFVPYCFAGNHIWPAFYLLVPIHHYFDIHGILAAQSIVVASGAFATYFLARDITKNTWWGVSFALAYLCQPTLSIGVLFDFHLELFAVPFSIFALLGLRRNNMWFLPCMLLSWAFYEINALVWFVLGLCLLVIPQRRKAGLLIAGTSLLYICILYFICMPYFKGTTEASLHIWDRYAHLGSSFGEAFKTILLHPIQSLQASVSWSEILKTRYLFLVFGFLPFFSFRHFLPALPLFLTLLASNWSVSSDIRYGYLAPILPFIVLSAAHGADELSKRIKKHNRHFAFYGPIFVTVIAAVLLIYFQVKRPFRRAPFIDRHNLAELKLAKTMIPENASLSADIHIGPHFANRSVLLLTPTTQYQTEHVDYIFTDLSDSGFKESNWPRAMKKLVSNGGYGPILFTNDVLILEKGIVNPALSNQVLKRLDEVAATWSR